MADFKVDSVVLWLFGSLLQMSNLNKAALKRFL